MTNIQENTYIVYKKLGETPKECVERYKSENPNLESVPMTYAGRLDPMAEGVLVLLSGEVIEKKEEFLDLPKTYVFKVLWGFETDTSDLLGLVLDKNKTVPEIQDVKDFIKKSVGDFSQKYPAYSSKPVEGKPLFLWAREGKLSQIDIPRHKVSLYKAEFISREKIAKDVLSLEIKNKVSLIKGDFRQEKIKEKWEVEFLNDTKDYFLDTIEVSVSSGFYIRQFVSDLALNFKTSALAFHILRTKVGDYEIL